MPVIPTRATVSRSIARHYTRPGFLISASLLCCTVAAWWLLDRNEAEHAYRLDEIVLVLGVLVSSLLYVITSLWTTLKKDVLELTRTNKVLLQQQALLRISERRSQQLFETNPQPMWVYDLETLRFLDVNNAAVRNYGYSREEFLRMTLLDIRPEVERGTFLERYAANRNRFEKEGHWRHKRKDGSTLLVHISAYRHVTRGREVELVLASDVTAKVEAEEALKKSELSFRSFVYNAPYSIFRSSINEDRFLEVNPALVQTLEYDSADEVQQKSVLNEICTDRGDGAQLIQTLRDQGSVESAEIDFKKKNGETIRVRVSGRLCADASGRPCLFEGFFENVTEKRRLEDQLRQSQKMDAIGRLTAGVAHDFNNLLMLISGYVSQLTENPSLAEGHATCEQILAITKRAASVTKQLLTFSRKLPSEPTMADLNAIVLDMERILRRLLSDQVQLQIAVSSDPHPVWVDVSQIELMLINLAINAQDAMPEGGLLSIATTSEVHSSEENGPGGNSQLFAVLQVSDTGHGIAPEVQAHIFEPFFTTKQLGKGTGLGLSTVLGIVERAGGHIKVVSELNRGTTFKICLPQLRDASAVPFGAPAELPPSRGIETILLAEDESGIRAMTRAYLETLGYCVIEAADGPEAILRSSEYRGQIDLVLTDVLMPGIRGDAAVEEIRKERPGIKAIFMSGYTDHDIAGTFDNILHKPFEFPELGRRVRMVLDAPATGNGNLDPAAD